jgi:hypothetical protein
VKGHSIQSLIKQLQFLSYEITEHTGSFLKLFPMIHDLQKEYTGNMCFLCNVHLKHFSVQ